MRAFVGVIAAALVWTSGGPASAQAFGLEPGTPMRNIEVVETLGDGVYTVSVPQPNAAFESYMVVATAAHGVCKVVGIGRTLRADRSGSQVRSVYDDLQSAITAKYGQPSNDFDFLTANALWDGPNEWSASIRQNERTVATYWKRPETASLADNLSGIGLVVNAVNLNDTYVSLTYELSNWAECSAARRAVNNSGL